MTHESTTDNWEMLGEFDTEDEAIDAANIALEIAANPNTQVWDREVE